MILLVNPQLFLLIFPQSRYDEMLTHKKSVPSSGHLNLLSVDNFMLENKEIDNKTVSLTKYDGTPFLPRELKNRVKELLD